MDYDPMRNTETNRSISDEESAHGQKILSRLQQEESITDRDVLCGRSKLAFNHGKCSDPSPVTVNNGDLTLATPLSWQ